MLLVKEALDIANGYSPELVNTSVEDIRHLSYEMKRHQSWKRGGDLLSVGYLS